MTLVMFSSARVEQDVRMTSRASTAPSARYVSEGLVRVAERHRGPRRLRHLHTYTATVPEGTAAFSALVDAGSDVDMLLKFGSRIASYADDGDRDHGDVESSSDPSIGLENPRAGVWDIDVVDLVAGTEANDALSVLGGERRLAPAWRRRLGRVSCERRYVVRRTRRLRAPAWRRRNAAGPPPP